MADNKKNSLLAWFNNLSKGAKIGVIVGVIVLVLLVVGLASNDDGQQAQEQKPLETVEQEKQSKTQAEKDLDDGTAVTEAMRKCTVMEASDIYRTGIGKKSKNVFNDGREACTEFLRETYNNDEEKFINAVNIDWANRKNEEIQGKNLEYYLSILGW